MPFAASSSTHPIAAAGIGECLGDLLERHGPRPDLAVVVVAGSHRHFVGEVLTGIARLLRPGLVVGAVSDAVLLGSGTPGPGFALLAGWDVDVEPLSPLSRGRDEGSGPEPVDLVFATDTDLVPEDDPFRRPTPDSVLRIGAVVDPRAGGSLIDGTDRGSGLVGVRLRGPGARAFTHRDTEVIGPACTVTASLVDDHGRSLVLGLAGERATDRLQAALESRRAVDGPAPRLPPLLVLADDAPGRDVTGPVVVEVTGWDLHRGAIQTSRPVPVGSAVRLHLPVDRPDLLRSVAGRSGADAAFAVAASATGSEPGSIEGVLGALDEAWSGPQVAGLVAPVVLGPAGGANLRSSAGVAVLALGSGR